MASSVRLPISLAFLLHRKFVLGPGLRGNCNIRASDIEKMVGISVRVLSRLRQKGEGPRFERKGRYYFYRPQTVMDWLNYLDAPHHVSCHD